MAANGAIYRQQTPSIHQLQGSDWLLLCEKHLTVDLDFNYPASGRGSVSSVSSDPRRKVRECGRWPSRWPHRGNFMQRGRGILFVVILTHQPSSPPWVAFLTHYTTGKHSGERWPSARAPSPPATLDDARRPFWWSQLRVATGI